MTINPNGIAVSIETKFGLEEILNSTFFSFPKRMKKAY
ncbi:hypothetical protein LEP1GSC124_2422 [Leptospira interrogans serovar Pyrogenes str. 200701872]|uniref:Uncharacterized protein n=1 Tax=Leptospira interrogans serovar Pyrogenes str. 200701872 TaxID=1193029 RepID=M6ZNV3_LEPIR|nr:hypothetical protein LEP1GSC124_2422 [Leptospira interrogans serovar Pyrogenes str. 200701872]